MPVGIAEGNGLQGFPKLCAAIGPAIPAHALLDGEIVYLDAEGKPQFYELMRRRSPQHYYAFDVLWLDGHDLRDIRLIERKRLLRGPVRPPVLYADHLEAREVDLFKAACDHDLERIVAKLATGRYELAATTWVKIKNRAYSQARIGPIFSMQDSPDERAVDLPLRLPAGA